MIRYPIIEPTKRNMSNDMDFCHSRDIYPINMRKNYWILLQKQD